MTQTERLRELLDELGVRWRNNDTAKWRNPPHERSTAFYDENGKEVTVTQALSGRLAMTGRSGLTPEQAVEATLGRGTCRDVCNSVSEFTCSACGFNCDLTSWISLFDGDDGRHQHHHHGTPNFCPNCGAKVV